MQVRINGKHPCCINFRELALARAEWMEGYLRAQAAGWGVADPCQCLENLAQWTLGPL